MAWFSLGLLALISFALSAWAYGLDRSRSDLLGTSLVLALTWPLTDLVGRVLSPPYSMLLGPVMDLAFVAGLILAQKQKPEKWKLALITLLAFQALMHVAYQASSNHPQALESYIAELNVAYAVQLILVAFTGARDVFLYHRRRARGFSDYQPGHKGLG